MCLVLLLGGVGVGLDVYLKFKSLGEESFLARAVGSLGWAGFLIATALACLPSTLGFIADVVSLFTRRGHDGHDPDVAPAASPVPPLSAEDASLRQSLVTAAHGAIGGLLTGPIFLAFYYIRDFGHGQPDISERYVATLCPGLPHAALAISGAPYPSALSLLPEFMGFGFVAGLLLGALLPGWRRRLTALAESHWSLRWLRNTYVATIFFGALWGALLGAAVNPMFFGQNDGRPFMRLSTAAYAAQVAVTLYLVLQLFSAWRSLPLQAIVRVVRLGVYALVFPIFFLSLDHFGNLSTYSYCHFYQSWDTDANRVVAGLRPVLVGAAYGCWLGVLVTWVVGGYLTAIEAVGAERPPGPAAASV